jgi:hypothetical protein
MGIISMEKLSQTKIEDNMIDEVIQQFNFERCHNVMTLINWEWTGVGVPTIKMLKDNSTIKLMSVIKGVKDKSNKVLANEPYFSSSGGLKATAWKNRYGHISGLKLEFVLAEWEADGD